MNNKLIVSAIQMVSGASLENNLQIAADLISQAAAQGAQLVALPEYFCMLGKKETDKLDIAETPGSGPIQDFLADCAHKHKIWLSSGSIPIISPAQGKVFNTQLIFNPAGQH